VSLTNDRFATEVAVPSLATPPNLRRDFPPGVSTNDITGQHFRQQKALKNIMGHKSEFLSISPERQFEPSDRSLVLYGAPRRTRNDLAKIQINAIQPTK
jgi:hypothetical protein